MFNQNDIEKVLLIPNQEKLYVSLIKKLKQDSLTLSKSLIIWKKICDTLINKKLFNENSIFILEKLSVSFHLDEQNLFIWTFSCILELNSQSSKNIDEKNQKNVKKIQEIVIKGVYVHFAKKRWAKESIKRWNMGLNKNIFSKDKLVTSFKMIFVEAFYDCIEFEQINSNSSLFDVQMPVFQVLSNLCEKKLILKVTHSTCQFLKKVVSSLEEVAYFLKIYQKFVNNLKNLNLEAKNGFLEIENFLNRLDFQKVTKSKADKNDEMRQESPRKKSKAEKKDNQKIICNEQISNLNSNSNSNSKKKKPKDNKDSTFANINENSKNEITTTDIHTTENGFTQTTLLENQEKNEKKNKKKQKNSETTQKNSKESIYESPKPKKDKELPFQGLTNLSSERDFDESQDENNEYYVSSSKKNESPKVTSCPIF